MPRFFQAQGAPVSFEGPKVAQGGGGGSSRQTAPRPTDESVKQAKVAAAYKGSLVDASPATMSSDVVASHEAEVDVSGMSVNIPQTGEMVSDPNKYYENLRAVGLGDFAQKSQEQELKIKQDAIVLENKKMLQYAEHTRAALSFAKAGDMRMAVSVANKVHAPGERITRIQPVDKDNFIIFSEDNPEGTPLNATEVDKVLVGAEKRMEGYFPSQTKRLGNKDVVYQINKVTGQEAVLAQVEVPDASAKDAEKANPLRKEYLTDKRTQDYVVTGSAFSRLVSLNSIATKDPNARASAHVGMVYAFQRINDPDSVTRETEFKTISEARAWLDQADTNGIRVPNIVRQSIEKIETGGFMTPEQQKGMLDSGRAVYNGIETLHKQTTRGAYERYADAAGVRRDLVVQTFDFEKAIEKQISDAQGPDVPSKADAPGSYKDENEVKAALKGNKISRDEAKRLIQLMRTKK